MAVDMVSCPECGLMAEVTRRDWVASTAGPVRTSSRSVRAASLVSDARRRRQGRVDPSQGVRALPMYVVVELNLAPGCIRVW